MRLTSLIKLGIQKLSFFMLGFSSRSGQTSSSSRDALHSAKTLRDHSVFRFVFAGTYPLQIFLCAHFLNSFRWFYLFLFLWGFKIWIIIFFIHHKQKESYFLNFLTTKGQGQGQYCFAHAQMPLISMASEDKQDITWSWVCYRYTLNDIHNSSG